MQENPLGYRPIGKLLIQFAIPSVISMVVNALYNIVDQIFIGIGVGYLGNAATTVVLPLMTILLAIGTMIGGGSSAYAALKLGEGNKEEAHKTLGCEVVALIVIGIFVTIFCLLFLDPILNIFGATSANIEYAKTYGSIIILGATFNLLGLGLSNMARCDGAPKVAMYSMVIGAIINTILDPIFIFIFKWGVAGAALATITSQFVGALILIYYFVKKANMKLNKKIIAFNLQRMLTICSLGMSSGITQGAISIMQIVLNNSLVHYGDLCSVSGDVALSAMGVVSKVSMLIISICVGIGVGAQPILGYNRGANQPKRIKKTYLSAVCIATCVAVLGWCMCQFAPHIVLSLFGGGDVNFMSFAIKAMRTYMFCVFCCGFQITATNYFQATGQPLKASVLSMLRQLILLIPLIIIMPLFFGLDGILYAGPIADALSAIIVFVFISFEMKKLNKEINHSTIIEHGV